MAVVQPTDLAGYSYWRFAIKSMRAGSPFSATAPRWLCKPPSESIGPMGRQCKVGSACSAGHENLLAGNSAVYTI